jgi:hypothetical protein
MASRLVPVFLATAVAPLAVVPVLAIFYAHPAIGGAGYRFFIPTAAATLMVVYPAAFGIGIPIHFLLARFRVTSLADYCLFGAILGALPIIGYNIVGTTFDSHFHWAEVGQSIRVNLEWGILGSLLFGTASAAMAAVFWWIAVRPSRRTA